MEAGVPGEGDSPCKHREKRCVCVLVKYRCSNLRRDHTIPTCQPTCFPNQIYIFRGCRPSLQQPHHTLQRPESYLDSLTAKKQGHNCSWDIQIASHRKPGPLERTPSMGRVFPKTHSSQVSALITSVTQQHLMEQRRHADLTLLFSLSLPQF